MSPSFSFILYRINLHPPSHWQPVSCAFVRLSAQKMTRQMVAARCGEDVQQTLGTTRLFRKLLSEGSMSATEEPVLSCERKRAVRRARCKLSQRSYHQAIIDRPLCTGEGAANVSNVALS